MGEFFYLKAQQAFKVKNQDDLSKYSENSPLFQPDFDYFGYHTNFYQNVGMCIGLSSLCTSLWSTGVA